MHELPAVEDLIRTLDEESERRGISRIEEVHIVIGELSSYVGECVNMYFDLLSAGHTCEGAKLFFEHTKARFKCSCCGLEFDHGAKVYLNGRRYDFEHDSIYVAKTLIEAENLKYDQDNAD